MKFSATTHGFSLIELMMAVAILGIISAIAIPSYGKYVKDSRRVDAQIGLRDTAQRLERCRTQSFTYIGCDENLPANSPDEYYTLSVSNLTASAYLLTATATNEQASDTDCATLTLTQAGATNSAPSADCWQ